MTLRAVLRNGTVVDLAPLYRSLDDVMALLNAEDSLTGSAVPFAEVTLERADGGPPVPYADVNQFLDGEASR